VENRKLAAGIDCLKRGKGYRKGAKAKLNLRDKGAGRPNRDTPHIVCLAYGWTLTEGRCVGWG
jgi:hypothetical protein